jgi:hypothetical protein
MLVLSLASVLSHLVHHSKRRSVDIPLINFMGGKSYFLQKILINYVLIRLAFNLNLDVFHELDNTLSRHLKVVLDKILSIHSLFND